MFRKSMNSSINWEKKMFN